jgi:ketopantoate reductase
MTKTIAIIGIGGRTGAMFAQELKGSNSILGVGMEKEVEEINKGNLFLKRNKKAPEIFKAEMIKDTDFKEASIPDAIFLCTKNPITAAIKYYYQIVKEKGGKIPALFISQNGIVASDEAINALKDIFGDEAGKIQLVRINLFNSVGREVVDGKVYLNYFLPIRLVFGPVSGSFGKEEIKDIFNNTGIEAEEISRENVKNMEYSKLFLNLIGMASASCGVSVEKGFQDEKVFKEEVGMLREYIKIVHTKGGSFLNFAHYPVKTMALIFEVVPISLLSIFRNQIGKAIDKGRKGKKKDLDEIEYYNGIVVDLGKKMGLPISINQEIIKRVS